MTTLTRLLAVLVFLLSAAAAAVDALIFDMPSGTSKCFAELLHDGADIHTSYRVAKSTSVVTSTVSVRVIGPEGEELHLMEGAKRGRFVFQAAGYGQYMACFWTPHYERGAIVSAELQWAIGNLAHAEGPLPTVATWWPITKAKDKSVLEVEVILSS
ncbi:hypothetical protein ACQ4PT_039352 [Festuca glaucescens]